MTVGDAVRIKKNNDAIWHQNLALGKAAYESGHLAIGDKLLQAALHECGDDEELFLLLAATFADIGNLLALKGRPDRAEKMLKKALIVYERLKSDTALAHACRVLYRLAELSVKRNKHEVALRYFGKALILSRKSTTLSQQEHLIMLKSLTNAWFLKGRHEEAMLAHDKAGRVLESIKSSP